MLAMVRSFDEYRPRTGINYYNSLEVILENHLGGLDVPENGLIAMLGCDLA
jgi:hypothetical protein